MKWFEVEPHYAFHYAGAWNEVNEKGEEVVVVYAASYKDIQIDYQYSEHPFDKNVG